MRTALIGALLALVGLPGCCAVLCPREPTPEQLHQDPDLRTSPTAKRDARWWFDEYNIDWVGSESGH